jgi:hypothetical protein
MAEVEAVATIDRPEKYSHLDINEFTLYSAFTFHLHGLPCDYASLWLVDPPGAFPVCYTSLTNPLRHAPLHKRLFSWQSRMGRCGGDGRRNQGHEVVNLAVKRLALYNQDPGGMAIPPKHPILETKHIRSDSSPPRDMYAEAGGLHAKDAAMNCVLCSTLSKSCLLYSSTSSDYALRQAEITKFRKHLRNRL